MKAPRPVLILGKGKTGDSFVNYFLKKNQPFVTYDTRVKKKDFRLKENLKFNLTLKNEIDFRNISFVACSPGFDLNDEIIKEAHKRNIKIKSDIEIFVKENASRKIIITGTNGKSSVCSWLEKLFQKNNIDTIAIGNIGKPVLEYTNVQKDFIIIEVSSFHLEISKLPKFHLSVLLNVSPDHLDRHKNFDDYLRIKSMINETSLISIANSKLEGIVPKVDYYFDGNGSLNDQNFNAVKEICSSLNLKFSEKEILSSFDPLPHRMESFYELSENITFIDDSKATNTASSLEGLKSIDKSKKLIVICGGESKNQNFKSYCDFLNSRAENIFYFGESSVFFKKFLDPSKSKEVKSLKKAVSLAFKVKQNNSVIILSPACSSLDMFDSFVERGKKFKHLVKSAKV